MSVIVNLTPDIQFMHEGVLYSLSEFSKGFNEELLITAKPVEEKPFNEQLIKE